MQPDPIADTPPPNADTPAAIAAGSDVVHLPLDAIVSDDTTYMFRLQLRVSPLRVNIQNEGQQLPVIVRPVPGSDPARYQLISGFRRLTAIRELGWPTIAAIVRHDLADDESAFRASVVENVARRSYSDIDRAMVIRSYKDRGFKGADIARALGLDNRSRKMLASLLKMPEAIQEAVDDPDHPFTTKHAVLLWRQRQKHPSIRIRAWVDLVRDEHLTAEAMVRRIQEKFPAERSARAPFRTLFQQRGTNLEAGQVWFAPTRVDLKTMSDDERQALRTELQTLLAAMDEG
jgi:ParB/RepB/Spo0J family partition protein